MDGIQVFALLVSIVEFALLLIVFVVKAIKSDDFVSFELETMASFRLLLTLFTMNNIILSTVYVWARCPRGARLNAAATAAVLGIVGWTVLSVSDMDSLEHMVGICLFLVGQGVLLLLQYMLANAPSGVATALFVGYAATSLCALLFLVLDFAGEPGLAAVVEWIALISNAALLVLFWATNPFHPDTAVRGEAVPLVSCEAPVEYGWL